MGTGRVEVRLHAELARMLDRMGRETRRSRSDVTFSTATYG